VSVASAYLYDLVLTATEAAGLRQWRRELLAPLAGRVLEVGAGTGHNLALYPPGVTELDLVEPDRHMRRRLGARMSQLHVPVTVTAAEAETLPYPDGIFDAVVVTLVLCTVRDPVAVLAELRRVLRPDGQLAIIEHVGAPPGTRTARAQALAEPLWRRIAGNCHLTRDTATTLDEAGFDVSTLAHSTLPAAPSLLRPAIRGLLRQQGAPA